MARQTKFIVDIIPMTRQPWTIKVLVDNKTQPRNPISGSTKYQRILLCDSKGTEVQATIFGDDIGLFKDILIESKKYYISNANVRPIQHKHRIVTNDYQWIINSRTLVEEVEAEEVVPYPQPSKFVPLEHLKKYKDKPETLSLYYTIIKLPLLDYYCQLFNKFNFS
ncbi:hypothetical protein L1049_027382 [Liquidambar formosana]|uniref:Replication protein A 70 kDa DNA-binding subunit B/D first OB fold domain-containing protein n=1 Tax=Liquidambar formosana TaxID=63359 RepID=A0AAP0WUX4_LIQFO